MEIAIKHGSITWLVLHGFDGYIHNIPANEDHSAQYDCFCDPVRIRPYGSARVFIHRVLTC